MSGAEQSASGAGLSASPLRLAPLRVALIGMGRMGRAIDGLAAERDIEIVARIDGKSTGTGIASDALAGAQVAIEFSVPDAAVANAIACLDAGCPVVIGTTGWSAERSRLHNAITATGGRALWSPNFSLGVQLFLAIIEDAAARVRAFESFDTHIVETHHRAKLDAPSGTGIAMQTAMAEILGHPVGITSARVGFVPGTHEVVLDAPFEQLRLVHEARDRRVFADGAITAARWLSAERASGIYTMRDVMQPTMRDVMQPNPGASSE